jgi:hypothetical protein
MNRLSLLVGLLLTCTGVSLIGCAGSETQDVLLEPTSPATSTPNPTGSPTTGTPPTDNPGSPTACTPEDEPNNDEAHANVLAPSRCGSLSSDDQIDVLTFRLKKTTTTLSITLTGKVKLRVSVKGGNTVELTPDTTSDIPFVMNEDYFIEVTELNPGKAVITWKVAIVEK